jgi:dTDP-4-dehydrorhamnose reductase
MLKVAVIGSSGMLGSTMAKVLENDQLDVYEFNRTGIPVTNKSNIYKFDATSVSSFFAKISELEIKYIVNCVGMIKQIIKDDDPNSVKLASTINTDFPTLLNNYAQDTGSSIIQIGTDCVFSGKNGLYTEAHAHDPIDVYGVTKSLGEKHSNSSMTIRCSIIGKEITTANSLLEWVLAQPLRSSIDGYTNHFWNGVTTLQFSRIVSGILKSDNYKQGVFHLVPKGIISKYELIRLITAIFERNDLHVEKYKAENLVDRSLNTVFPEQNLTLWHNARYNEIPTIEEMIFEYKSWLRLNK